MNHDAIDSLIRQTQPQPEFPASFQREVWARIAVAEQRSWAGAWKAWGEDLFLWLARPAPALATVAVMLAAGVSLGGLTAPDSSAALRSAYAVSINPLNAGTMSATPEQP